MRNKVIQKLLLVLCISFSPFLWKNSGNKLLAQKQLKDTMLRVVKSFQPTIADAYKINDMPVVKDSVPPKPELSYNINSKQIFTPFNVARLKPATMVREPIAKLYNSLVKIGGGNYKTTYAEIYYNNLRSKDASYGTYLKHLSSQATYEGYGFGGFSDNAVGLYGKKLLRKHTLSGDFDYTRNVIHYYGYDTSILHFVDDEDELTKQRYSNILGNISLQSHYTDSTHINYLFHIKYDNLTDYYNASENNICGTAEVSRYYEKQLIHVPLLLDYYNNKFIADSSHSLIAGLSPYLLSTNSNWSTQLGVKIILENNSNIKTRFLFYPNIEFAYNALGDILVPYAGITGGLKKNSLKSLTDENPFLIPSPRLQNTNTKWDLYGGLKGNINKAISYNTHVSYNQVQDMCFFINDNSNSLIGFNTVYDNITLLNIHGELQFQYSEKIKVIAKGDYNKYTTTYEEKPWQKPLWQGDLLINYNLKNKIVATADIFLYGKRNVKIQKSGPFVSVFTNKELKAIADINIGLEYRYSKRLSAFLKFNNLAFKRYEYWNNYPTQKFNFLAGITMTF